MMRRARRRAQRHERFQDQPVARREELRVVLERDIVDRHYGWARAQRGRVISYVQEVIAFTQGMDRHGQRDTQEGVSRPDALDASVGWQRLLRFG